jgi:hypothetical protein
MDFDIYELKILLSTNIKSKKDSVFTKDILHSKEEGFSVDTNLNTYPYFTNDVMYSRRNLIRLTYQERVNFFFDRERFKELLSSYKIPINENTDRNSVVENNIMIMLELLLPTKFPAIKDLKQSYKMVFNNDGFSDHLYEAFIYNQPFSYLKLNGKTYTVKRVIWLNDILNHPIYKKLLDEYRKFVVWCKEEKENAKVIMEKTTENLANEINVLIANIINLINAFTTNNASTTYSLLSGREKNVSETVQELLVLYRIQSLFNKMSGDDSLVIKLTLDGLNKQLDKLLREEDQKVNELLNDADVTNETFFLDQIAQILDTNLKGKTTVETNKFLYAKTEGKQKDYTLVSLAKSATSQYKSILKTINDMYFKISKSTIKEDIAKFDRVNILFELPYVEVEKKYASANKTVPPVYRNFMYSLLNQEYRRPYRETTNALLQDLIDCKTEEKVKEFFIFMEQVYQYFLKNNAKFRLKKAERSLLKVDMNYININQSSGIKREIQVMIDLIEGEVVEENVKQIYCPFYGQHLGNEFEYLFRMFYYGAQVQDWDVTKNRMMFSLEKMSIENMGVSGNKPLEVVGKPLLMEKDKANLNIQNQNVAKENANKPAAVVNPEKMITYFLDKIVSKNQKLKSNLEALNKISRGELIYDTTLLEQIKKNNKELYEALGKWSEKEYEKSSSVIDLLISLKNKYAGLNEKIDYELSRYDISFDEDKKYKLQYQKGLNTIYSNVVEELLNNEKDKNIQRAQLGGTVRSRNRTSLRTTRKK